MATGPFDIGASGSLYGIYDQGVPSNNLIEGMGPLQVWLPGRP
jgi:hypothetical protein